MKKVILLFSFVLVLLLSNNVFAKKAYFPISLGVYWGNIKVYDPTLHIIASYPNWITSFVGDLAIMKFGKDIADAYVNYVDKATGDAMKTFLKEAKDLALKNGAHYYGVSNFRINIIYINNALLVVSGGDIVCGN